MIEARAEAFPFLRKRGGHTLSKGRLLGAQMAAYLEDGLWLDLAARANAAARRLFDGLVALPGVRAALAGEANEVFVIAPTSRLTAWRAAGADFYDWPTRGVPPERARGTARNADPSGNLLRNLRRRDRIVLLALARDAMIKCPNEALI